MDLSTDHVSMYYRWERIYFFSITYKTFTETNYVIGPRGSHNKFQESDDIVLPEICIK